jgi:sugar phosphate permease
MQEIPEVIDQNKIMREQLKVFAITYFGYVQIHLFREFWAMSKKSMILQAEE